VRIMVRIRFSVWLVSGYAHLFVPTSAVILNFINSHVLGDVGN